MLDDGLLDFVFGVAHVHKGQWVTTFLYREPLQFIPRRLEWTASPQGSPVRLKDIGDETYVMVPDACGLSRATRALFRSHRRKLHEYSGEAMSYQVLEQWAALGIGAAILPKSKLSTHAPCARSIIDKSGQEVTLAFEAAWARTAAHSTHLREFADHLRHIVPALVAGLGGPPARQMRPGRQGQSTA